MTAGSRSCSHTPGEAPFLPVSVSPPCVSSLIELDKSGRSALRLRQLSASHPPSSLCLSLPEPACLSACLPVFLSVRTDAALSSEAVCEVRRVQDVTLASLNQLR